MPLSPFLRGKPTQAGGKERFLHRIDHFTKESLGISDLRPYSYVDVFAGACSYSLHRKLFGCKELHSNDIATLNHYIIQGLVCNHRHHIDLEQIIHPAESSEFIQQDMCPTVFPSGHGLILDWLVSTAHQKRCPQQQGL